MDIIGLLVGILCLIYVLTFAYSCWFRSEEYIKESREKRAWAKKKYPFLPQVWFTGFYDKHSTYDLWRSRIISLLAILICMLIIYGSLVR